MKMFRKLICGCLAICLMLSLLPMRAFAEEAETLARIESGPACSAEETMSPEEQYERYALQAFYGEQISTFGFAAGNRLQGDEKVIYDALVPLLRQVAAGERSSASFTIGKPVNYQGSYYPVDVETTFTCEEVTNEMFGRLLDTLLADLPYDLYWFDKVSGYWMGGGFVNGEGTFVQMTICFTVASDYRGADELTADISKTSVASRAAENAFAIVQRYARCSDYEKLVAYKNEINALVSYDHPAADGGADYFHTDIDPWQLISVFDGDSSTNVVCEGYSKAFMYLCDRTYFVNNIACYTVTGDIPGGAHMWNIVSINGKNYLVDVTNSDTGTIGQNGGLFLNGAVGDPVNGYTLIGVRFTYDTDMLELWGNGSDSILYLEATDYDPSTAMVEVPQITAFENLVDGIKITWREVPGAARYRVYLETSDGWQNLGSTTGTSFVYNAVESGKTYKFTLRCVNDADDTFTSDYNIIGWEQTYVAQPAVSGFENTAEGIKITWAAVPGAAQYRVFVKTASGWAKVGDTADTSYVYTGAKSGSTYTFTVRAMNHAATGYTSTYNANGWTQSYIAQPAITKLENTAEGVAVRWNAVDGAGSYRVYIQAGNGWRIVGETADTNLLWTEAESGETYVFTIRALNVDPSAPGSGYNADGWKHTYLSQPAIANLESAPGGLKLTWDPIPGAAKYRLFVKTTKGWTVLADTAGTEYVYTDAEPGKTYTFTVRCVTADGKSYTTGYHAAGWTHTYSPVPAVTKLESSAAGIKITWGAINNAAKYRVFIKNANGGWTIVGDTTATSFTWSGAEVGVTYTFTVRCINAAGTSYTSGYNATGWNQIYAAQPEVTDFENREEGLQLAWDPVDGVALYRIFVKDANGAWTKVGDTTDTSFVYTDAKLGQSYTFTVRCMNEDGVTFASAYNTTGWSHTFEPIPGFSQLESTTGGIKLTWGAINGAEKYRVFVKNASGSWVKAGDTTGTSFVYTAAKTGESYTFTVRCINGTGGFTSGYHTAGWKHTYMPEPEVTKMESVTGGIKLTWGGINGAQKYRVFVKNASGAWVKAGDTTGTSFVYTGAKSGTAYTFTVRCVNTTGGFTSGYHATGWTFTYVEQPAVSKMESGQDGVKITWNAVDGAQKYRVFVKNASGAWVKAGDTTDTSFVYTAAKTGESYTFTVRCIDANGVFASGYNTTGWTHTYMPTPEVTKLENTGTGIKLTWGAINGAEKYRVFVKNASGAWVKAGDTTGTSFTWTGAVSGESYTFTVRCINGTGGFTSAYNPTGWSITRS